MTLPHRFPFRLVDRTADSVVLRLTANAHWLRDRTTLDLPLLIEATAQAAALLTMPEAAAPDDLLLAGVSDCELVRAVAVGESLEFEVVIQARMGAAVRVGATIRSAGDEIARLSLTLTGSAR